MKNTQYQAPGRTNLPRLCPNSVNVSRSTWLRLPFPEGFSVEVDHAVSWPSVCTYPSAGRVRGPRACRWSQSRWSDTTRVPANPPSVPSVLFTRLSLCLCQSDASLRPLAAVKQTRSWISPRKQARLAAILILILKREPITSPVLMKCEADLCVYVACFNALFKS